MSAQGPAARVVHVVPALPPAVNGLGDFALRLATAMRERQGVEARFIAASPAPIADLGMPARSLPRREAAGLAAALEELADDHRARVILHLSAYGYAKRGCPFWLRAAISDWRRQHADARVVTIFHELYAFQAPWRSSFWLAPFQRGIVRGLALASDAAFTSAGRYADTLRSWGAAHVIALPVFSNVGEPTDGVPPSRRPPLAVIFGSAPTRARAYRSTGLSEACREHAIDEVLDIGPDPAAAPATFGGRPVRRLGALAATEVSAQLARARLGLIDYHDLLLAKSGVFAAYCAHGAAPVLGREQSTDADGLRRGEHYAIGGQKADLDAVAASAQAWYRGHDLAAHSAAYAEALLR